ncbi:MAG: hypothetical protein R3E90_08920 [Marinicella sp.]|nr:hypothetical protein [Xanthomonadales bacterium]
MNHKIRIHLAYENGYHYDIRNSSSYLVMNWTIKYTPKWKNNQEALLTLVSSHQRHPLREWYGPLAELIFCSSYKHLSKHISMTTQQFDIEKQLAQFILMQACFLHQKCLHEYQVNQDTKKAGLTNNNDLAELLLFIRMTSNHPNQHSLMTFHNAQIPWCDDFETRIDNLINSKLIQHIRYKNMDFFDKNPYPHDHILDLHDKVLFDYQQNFPIREHQKLIVGKLF